MLVFQILPLLRHSNSSFLGDSEPDIQEQAFNILRNLAENEEGIAMVFREIPQVLGRLVEGMGSSHEDVVLQSNFALANLANGTHEHQELIIKYPQLLSTLQVCLAEFTPAVRRPAISCVLTLAEANPRRRKEMAEAGIVDTLRRLCDWSGHAPESNHHEHDFSSSNTSIGGLVNPNNASTGRSEVISVLGGRGSNRSISVNGMTIGTARSGHTPYSFGRHGHGSGIADGHGYTGGAPGHRVSSHLASLDDDRDVIQRARSALECLERGESYITQ